MRAEYNSDSVQKILTDAFRQELKKSFVDIQDKMVAEFSKEAIRVAAELAARCDVALFKKAGMPNCYEVSVSLQLEGI